MSRIRDELAYFLQENHEIILHALHAHAEHLDRAASHMQEPRDVTHVGSPSTGRNGPFSTSMLVHLPPEAIGTNARTARTVAKRLEWLIAEAHDEWEANQW